MSKHLLYIIILLVFNLNAQEKGKTDSFGASDEVKIENAPNFYAKKFADYRLNADWSIRVEMIQHDIGDKTLFEFPLLSKYNINNKLSVLLGPKIDLLKRKDGVIEHAALHSVFGLQYEPTKNLQLDTHFNYRITNEELPIKNHYSAGSRSTFKLGSRFKF